MTQTVRVVERLKKDLCTVEVKRESACGGNCASCAGCSSANESLIALAVNTAGASAGDTVVVESRNRDIYGVAALVYLVPVFLLVAGYLIGDAMSPAEAAGGIGAGAGFLGGILAAVLYGKRRKDKVYLEVIRIL